MAAAMESTPAVSGVRRCVVSEGTAGTAIYMQFAMDGQNREDGTTAAFNQLQRCRSSGN